MIYPETILLVADNSGAKKVKCIKILGGTTRGYGSIGDIIVVSVRSTTSNRQNSLIKKGYVCKGVIVRTKSPLVRENGMTLRFSSNQVVLLNDQKRPMGNRVFGPVPKELRQKNFTSILSMSEEVV